MIQLNRREVRLALITLIVVLIGLTYWIGEPQYEAWQESSGQMDLLVREKMAAQRLLDQQGELDSRLSVLREALPSYAMGVDVTAQKLRNLQRFADEHNLLLLRREPEPERQIGDLYELAITCTWEGELSALVPFLYALQAQGAIVDVRQLTISPARDSAERLRGTLTVDYAYSRQAAEP